MRNPFGVRGGVIAMPFFMWMQRISLPKGPFCQSRGVLVPVVPHVVRRLVVQKPVMGSPIVCWVWFRVRPVVQGVILWRCGRHMRVASQTTSAGAPNTPLQPTASRARSFVFEGFARRARGG